MRASAIRVNVAPIRSYCKDKNITIAEFEKRAGLSNGAVGTWESEMRFAPRADNLKKAADLIGVPMETLLTSEQEAANAAQ